MAQDTTSVPPQQTLMGLMSGYWISQAIHVAAALGIADLLKPRPRTCADLAQATDAHAPALYRLLRALASIGIFAETEDGRFQNTPISACLATDAPGSQRSAAILMGEEFYRAWGELRFSVKTGKTAFEHVFGKPIFEYLAANPRSAKLFDDTMVGVHGAETDQMLDAYDFSSIGTLVDIGGGNGSLLCGVLRRHSNLNGVLFDRFDVIERARANLVAAGVDKRCEAKVGNFFEEVPAGGDAYLLRHIIHDWYDEQALVILGNCRKVMTKTNKLLLVESVIPSGNDPFLGKLLDLTMMIIPGGMERTELEYRELLKKAGFRLVRIVPTCGEVAILECESA